jgi:hypothetical protein
VVAAVVSAWILLRRAREPVLEPQPGAIPVAAAAAALEASLHDVAYHGSDPRKRIAQAYHTLVNAIAVAGAPRRPQEAPYEYLHRALAPLGVEPAPMQRLTELYVLAQFGRRPTTHAHCSEAAAALEESLRRLRTVHGAAADTTPNGAATAAARHGEAAGA